MWAAAGSSCRWATLDLNQLDLANIQQYNYSLCVDTSIRIARWCQTSGRAFSLQRMRTTGSATVPLWVSLQQFPQFGNGNYGAGNGVIVHGYPGGDSDYSSLQTKVQKRLTHHFTALASFHLGQADDGRRQSAAGIRRIAPGCAAGLRGTCSLEHSVSPQDVKYQFTGQASYDLPVGKGRAVNLNGVGNAVLGGWTGNLIAYLSTGVPIASPTVGAGIAYFNQRPDLTCDPGSGAPHTASTWFNYNCFAIPSSPFVPGSAPAYLDHVRTMGAQDFDISLYKHFSFGKRRTSAFEIASYNIANRAQLGMPGTPSITAVQSDPSQAAQFGLITNTVNSPRQFQFGSRFTF